MKKFIVISLCMLIFIPFGASGQSQQEARDAKKVAVEEQVRMLVESGTFEISFDRANPVRGRSVILSPVYEMKFNNNCVSTYLPYFGRSYTAPANPAKLAIELNETVVETETVKTAKKDIPSFFRKNRNQRKHYLYLRISASGMASLSINSSSRTAITYLGFLKM